MILLSYQFDKDSPKTTVELSAESTLPQVLEAIQLFLAGAGYYVNGELVIEEDALNKDQ